jgi:hypothetical protein
VLARFGSKKGKAAGIVRILDRGACIRIYESSQLAAIRGISVEAFHAKRNLSGVLLLSHSAQQGIISSMSTIAFFKRKTGRLLGQGPYR